MNNLTSEKVKILVQIEIQIKLQQKKVFPSFNYLKFNKKQLRSENQSINMKT